MNKATINRRFERLLHKSFELKQSGEFPQAIKMLKSDFGNFSEEPAVLNQLTHCLILNGEIDEAIAFLRKSEAINADQAAIGWNTVRVLMKKQQYSEALLVARKNHQKFPNDIEGLAVLGACLRANNELLESLRYLTEAIDLDSSQAEAFINRGLIFISMKEYTKALRDLEHAFQVKPFIKDTWETIINLKLSFQEFKEALPLLERMAILDPQMGFIHFSIGVCHQKLGHCDKAITAYEKFINIQPNNAEALSNLSAALNARGDFLKAIDAARKALAINPNLAACHNNMGSSYRALDKFDDALCCYDTAINIQPTNSEAHNNRGLILLEKGQLDTAIDAFGKSLELRPNYKSAIENLLSLEIQLLLSNLGDNTNFLKIRKLPQNPISSPKFQVQNAIRSYLEADFNKSLTHISTFKQFKKQDINQLDSVTKVFCFAYGTFVEKLSRLQLSRAKECSRETTAIHLGESHCLSYAHRTICINGAKFSILPSLIVGAKAYHFSRKRDDQYKTIAQRILETIPKKSTLFISFGEIDCRHDEGFIVAAKKLNQPLDEIINHTVKGYLSWFVEQNKMHKHRLIILNVPAPVYNENIDKFSNLRVASVVDKFNTALQNQSNNLPLEIADTYQFTKDSHGFSNQLFHIDSVHLGPNAINEIEKQLN